jgi:hypothetical protein
MTVCQGVKKMSIVDNFRGKNLDMSKCQGTRCIGDNPFDGISVPTCILIPPTLYHRNGYGDIVMTTFFPLTVSGGPFFYYIRFPDKKGVLSVEGGETTVGSVTEGFYSPSTREPIRCYGHLVWSKIGPFIVETTQVEESGRIMDLRSISNLSGST